MIYERSCDSENWSNDAENSALHKLYSDKSYSVILKCKIGFTAFLIK